MNRIKETIFPNLSASFEKHTLQFKQPSGTSRGILTEKKLWTIKLRQSNESPIGIGECSIIEGLSPDYHSDEHYESELKKVCANPSYFLSNRESLTNQPSLLFGLETAYLDLVSGGKQLLFDNAFTRSEKSIPINGLVWMGDVDFMQQQIDEKITAGFSCIKLKVGAIDFDKEIELLTRIRNQFSTEQLTLRVDANGAFDPKDVLVKLHRLADLEIHSIEQPIRAGQGEVMRKLCATTPLPIALDEELIGISSISAKQQLLETIFPQFIILKPSLHGGLSGCDQWIEIAEQLSIPWWITSALESNIGLNAIAQFTGNYDTILPQGLGTGGLFQTNFHPRLRIEKGELFF